MARDYSRRLPAGTKVSAGTPIGRNVTAHFPLVRDFLSAVRGRPGLGVSTGPVLKPTVTGKAAVGNGVGKLATGLLASDLGMAGASPRTVIAEFMQLDVSGGRSVFSFGDTSALARSQFTLLSANNFRRVQLATYTNDYSYTLWDQTGTYARVFLAITYDGNVTVRVRSHCRVFLNDGTPQGVVSKSFVTTLPAALATGNTYPLDMMGGGTYGFASMNTELFNATFIGGRALTEREIDNFYRNPQQIMAAAPAFPYPLLDSAAVVAAPIELAGAVVARVAGAGTLTTSIPLSGQGALRVAVAGALSTGIALSGAATARVTAASTLSTSIPLVGATSVRMSAAGTLAGAGAVLEGGAAINVAASGALSTSIALSGVAGLQASASATLAGAGAALSGGAVVGASTGGVLSTAIPLSGTAVARASASGGLDGAGAVLSGVAVVSALAAGALTSSIALAGSAVTRVSASGSMAGAGAVLSGSASVHALVTGALATSIDLSGLVVSRVAASGSLMTWVRLAGAVSVRVSTAGILGEGVRYARAPAGSGYTPQRNEYQARPVQAGSTRPAAIQRNRR